MCLAEESICNHNFCNKNEDCTDPDCMQESQGGEQSTVEQLAGEQPAGGNEIIHIYVMIEYCVDKGRVSLLLEIVMVT